jgi:glycosyl transferase family 87
MPVSSEPARASGPADHQSSTWQPPHYVRSLSMAIPAVFLGFQISGWVFAVRALREGRVDFRAQYTAGYMLRSGNAHRLYDYATQFLVQNRLISPRTATMPFDHMAYEALLFAPFSFLRFKAAYLAFLVLNLASLFMSIVMIRRWTPTLNQLYPWLAPVMILAYLPTAVALMQGQESALLLLDLVVCYAALTNGDEVIAGIVLSLGMFKFQIILPIALLFVLWRRWRFVWGFSVSTIGLLLISFALVGMDAARSYLCLLMSMSVGLRSAADQVRLGVPPAAMPNLRGLVIGFLGHRVPVPGEQVTIGVLSAIIIAAAYVRGRRWPSTGRLLIATVAAALVSYHSLIHDMTILLLPLLVVLNGSITSIPAGPAALRNVAILATLLFVAPVLFCFVPASFFIVGLATCAFFYAVIQWTVALPANSVVAARGSR